MPSTEYSFRQAYDSAALETPSSRIARPAVTENLSRCFPFWILSVLRDDVGVVAQLGNEDMRASGPPFAGPASPECSSMFPGDRLLQAGELSLDAPPGFEQRLAGMDAKRGPSAAQAETLETDPRGSVAEGDQQKEGGVAGMLPGLFPTPIAACPRDPARAQEQEQTGSSAFEIDPEHRGQGDEVGSQGVARFSGVGLPQLVPDAGGPGGGGRPNLPTGDVEVGGSNGQAERCDSEEISPSGAGRCAAAPSDAQCGEARGEMPTSNEGGQVPFTTAQEMAKTSPAVAPRQSRGAAGLVVRVRPQDDSCPGQDTSRDGEAAEAPGFMPELVAAEQGAREAEGAVARSTRDAAGGSFGMGEAGVAAQGLPATGGSVGEAPSTEERHTDYKKHTREHRASEMRDEEKQGEGESHITNTEQLPGSGTAPPNSPPLAMVCETVPRLSHAAKPQWRRDIRRSYLSNLGMKRALVAGPGGTGRPPPMYRRSSFSDGVSARAVRSHFPSGLARGKGVDKRPKLVGVPTVRGQIYGARGRLDPGSSRAA